MTVTEYLRVLRRQWWVVLTLAVLGLGLACAYTFTATPVYSAQARMFVSVSTERGNVADLSSGSSFVQQRVKSYADIVTADEVLTRVISTLGLTMTPEQLAGQITAESPLDTVLLNLTVTDTDPHRAAAIANAVATTFPGYVSGLETVADEKVSPVEITMVTPASAPSAPSSPRIPLNLALGLLVGLGLGVGLGVLRDQLNTTVTTAADVEKVTGSVPLGVVPYDRGAAKQPLVDAGDRQGRAEAFRTLRTNLQFADVDDPPRVVVVTSAVPGEGKTTTSCNLAVTLAFSGASVALVEGDLRKPRVCAYMGGMSNAAGLTTVLTQQHELRDVLVQYEDTRIAVVPSGPTPPNPSELLGSEHMLKLVSALAEHFDCVVIDAPPLLPVTDAAVLASIADGVLLVARHGVTTRETLQRAMQTLTSVNAKLLGTVLNSVPARRGQGYANYSYGYGDGPAATQPTAAVLPKQRAPQVVDLTTTVAPVAPVADAAEPGGATDVVDVGDVGTLDEAAKLAGSPFPPAPGRRSLRKRLTRSGR